MDQVERYPTPDWLKHQEALWMQNQMAVKSAANGVGSAMNVAA